MEELKRKVVDPEKWLKLGVEPKPVRIDSYEGISLLATEQSLFAERIRKIDTLQG